MSDRRLVHVFAVSVASALVAGMVLMAVQYTYFERASAPRVVPERPRAGEGGASRSGGLGTERFDGLYDGRRGYTEVGRRSPNRSCLGAMPFVARIENGTITFASDGRTWTGTVGRQGEIVVRREGISPQTRHETRITARFRGDDRVTGRLYNGFCGEGYFELTAR